MTTSDNYTINGKTFSVLLSRNVIAETVKTLANRINHDYKGKTPVFLIVLKGSIFFGADLLREITLDCELKTIRAKSYGNSMLSSGKVNLLVTNIDIAGKDVIIVEDIVDTGLTLSALIDKLKSFEPKSLETVSLLSKPSQREVQVPVRYIGLEIDPSFVIGYGLDYDEKGRQLPDIYSLDEGRP